MNVALEKFIAATNTRFKQRNRKDIEVIEDIDIQHEITKAVQHHFRNIGYKYIRTLQLKNIYADDGEVLLENDAILVIVTDSKTILATIKVEQKVTASTIDIQSSRKNKFKELLHKLQMSSFTSTLAEEESALHTECCGVLKLYCDAKVHHFLGTLHLSEIDANYACNKKINVVTCRDGAFKVHVS